MDDYENDGRDYNENIDEGPIDEVSEFNFFPKKPNVTEEKPEVPEKKSSDLKKGRSCDCKDRKKHKIKLKKKKSTNNENNTNGTNNTNNKKILDTSIKKSGRRTRKKKERCLVNPFIIFYLEMYYKNPKRCVADIASEAGKIWCKMSAKQKEDYVKKARIASEKRKIAKLENKKMNNGKITKKIRKK